MIPKYSNSYLNHICIDNYRYKKKSLDKNYSFYFIYLFFGSVFVTIKSLLRQSKI